AIEFAAAGSLWKCSLGDYACRKTGPAPAFTGGRGGRGGRSPEADDESPWAGEDQDHWLLESPQQGQGGGRGGRGGAGAGAPETFRSSPDGNWEALIQNYNIYVRPKGGAAAALSSDGSEGNAYTLLSI